MLFLSCGSEANEKKSPSNSVNSSNATKNIQETELKEPIWLSGLSVKNEKMKAENCLDVPMEDWMEEQPEPFCASIEINLLKIALKEPSVAEKINNQIASAITGKKNNTNLKAFVNKVKSLNDIEEASAEEYSCSVIDSTNRLLCVGIGSNNMVYMAAHPNTNMTILNFDLETGSTISIKDVLVENYMKSLKSIVMKKFIKSNGKDGWEFSNLTNFKLSENIAIERKGLRFIYNTYEISSYANGAPEVFITWSDLKDLVKENPYINFD
jgi:hypothetical protein